MAKQLRIIILVCLVIASASLIFVLKSPKDTNRNPSSSQKPSYSPPEVLAESPKLTIIEAPDGKNKLVVKEEKTAEGTAYSFSITNNTTGISKQIFTKTASTGTIISVPFNTFSPDDKYIFLQENSPNGITYFVPLEGQTLDISSLFVEKHPDYKITDVTGWGGMTLIVVNTDKIAGGQGPSFWFDVTGKSFIQLSGRFN